MVLALINTKDIYKTIGIVFVVSLGIIVGIVIGYQIVGKQPAKAIASRLPGDSGVPDEIKLVMGPGDPFPLNDLTTTQGNEFNIHNYILGKKSGIIIISLGCAPCEEYLNQWNQIVTSKLKKNVQEIVLISLDGSSDLDKLPYYLENKLVYQIDRKQLEEKYNAVNFPTALAVGEDGIVMGVQYGSQQGIDYEILKFLTTHDI